MFQNLLKLLVPLSKYNILKIKVIFWYFKRKYVRTHLIKKAIYLLWKYFLGSTLQFALFKIKIRLLESDQNCLRHGSSTNPFLSLCKRVNITKKNLFEKINILWNTGHFDENNDAKHNIFRYLIPPI